MVGSMSMHHSNGHQHSHHHHQDFLHHNNDSKPINASSNINGEILVSENILSCLSISKKVVF